MKLGGGKGTSFNRARVTSAGGKIRSGKSWYQQAR